MTPGAGEPEPCWARTPQRTPTPTARARAATATSTSPRPVHRRKALVGEVALSAFSSPSTALRRCSMPAEACSVLSSTAAPPLWLRASGTQRADRLGQLSRSTRRSASERHRPAPGMSAPSRLALYNPRCTVSAPFAKSQCSSSCQGGPHAHLRPRRPPSPHRPPRGGAHRWPVGLLLPCPLPTGRQARCCNPARALVYLGDAALAQEIVAQAQDVARHRSTGSGQRLGLLAAGAGLAFNGGHGHWGGRDCHLSLWTEPLAALARAVWQAVRQGLHKEAPEPPPVRRRPW